MRSLSDAIRAKRYKLKNETPIVVKTLAPSNELISIKLSDCSLTGFSGQITENSQEVDILSSGTIFSSAKLVTPEGEYGLGRIALRRIDEKNKLVAFSTIDQRIPIDGTLSKYIDVEIEDNKSFAPFELNNNKFSLAHFVESDFNNVDLFDRVNKFSVYYNDWKNSDKYGYSSVRTSSKGPRINLEKVRNSGRNDYIIMGSNDYLGLSSHPRVIEAAKKALDTYGFGSTGSSVTTGITSLHRELCEYLASMFGREGAILFNSGYVANIGIISAITGSSDLIIADHLCHASIQDAMKMSSATSRLFKHDNIEHLEKILKRERNNYQGALVVTEGVFSMDGDVPRLDKLYEVARKYNCRIMLDQAHDFGVIGPKGLGASEKYNLTRKIDIIMGTFSKIGGGIGGFAVGDQDVIDWIFHFARSFIFSVSLPPSTCAAMLESLKIFNEDKSYFEKLHYNIKHFKNNLRSIGYDVPSDHESSIIPVIIGDEQKLGQMYQSMLEDGIFVVPIVYPAVSRNNCRFRFTIMANHTITDLDYAVASLEKAMLKSGFKFDQNDEKQKVS